jgi:hypothetical protein
VRTVRRVQAAGGATRTVMTDRRRAAARRVRQIASKLRTRSKLGREETTEVIRRVTGELAGLAEQAVVQAAAVLRNGRRAVPRALSGRVRGRLRRALAELAVTIERIRDRAGRTPRAVTADRGYGQPAVERDLRELGVQAIAIPRQGKISPTRQTIEHSRRFHRLVKWRTGSEGRISYLKRGTAGTAPAWTASPGPQSGAGTGSSPTTWSRSGPWPANQPSQAHPKARPAGEAGPRPRKTPFQVEVARGRAGAAGVSGRRG